MGIFLSKRELAQTEPAERLDFKSPVPTRMVSNGEFNPLPQTKRQDNSRNGSKIFPRPTPASSGWTVVNFCAPVAVWQRPSSL